MREYRVVELHGDGISAELSASVHAVADALPFRLVFEGIDLSDENRARLGDALYDQTVAAVKATTVALKYPTATTGTSPNKILRERLGFAVIHRAVRTFEGVATNFKKSLDIDVVRIATGGTYEDVGRRIGLDTAVSLRVIERGPSLLAARYAFRLAQMRASGVVSTSKHTIQRETDGLFEEAVRQIARDYPATAHRSELFDALLAGLIMRPERYAVIVCPNEYGDFLSDCAMGLVGSVGLGDSATYSFDSDGQIAVALFDPAGGTAPDIAGQDRCNPTAALLALANLVRHLGEKATGDALTTAVRAAIAAGEKTGDIGGQLGTKAFTAAVLRRLG